MNAYIVASLFIVFARIWGLNRTWKVAQFHGEEWCFDAPVASGFYTTSPGSGILRAYRRRMFAAFGIELGFGFVFFAVAGLACGFWAFFTATLISSMYTLVIVRRYAREAWNYAIPGAAPARPKRAVQLTPIRPDTYSSPALVWTLRAGTAAAIATLVFGWARSGGPIDWLMVVVIPALALYAQLGFLLIRRSLSEWRVCGIPESFADAAIQFRNEARAYHIFSFELLRAWIVMFLIVWASRLTFPEFRPFANEYRQFWVWPLVMGSLVLLFRRKRSLIAAAQRLRGVSSRPANTELPASNFHLAGLVYYDSEQPAMFVRRRNFLALNLAHPRSKLVVAYLVGWVIAIGLVWTLA